MIFFSKTFGETFDLWDPPKICANALWRNSDEEFYEVWHGGQGMLLIIDEKNADYCIKRGKILEFGENCRQNNQRKKPASENNFKINCW